jgi:hypothetical protein
MRRWNLAFLFDIWEEIFKYDSLLPTPDDTAEAIRNASARENAAYTFVGGRFVDRMRPEEVQSGENVLRSPIEGIRAFHDRFTNAQRSRKTGLPKQDQGIDQRGRSRLELPNASEQRHAGGCA